MVCYTTWRPWKRLVLRFHILFLFYFITAIYYTSQRPLERLIMQFQTLFSFTAIYYAPNGLLRDLLFSLSHSTPVIRLHSFSPLRLHSLATIIDSFSHYVSYSAFLYSTSQYSGKPVQGIKDRFKHVIRGSTTDLTRSQGIKTDYTIGQIGSGDGYVSLLLPFLGYTLWATGDGILC